MCKICIFFKWGAYCVRTLCTLYVYATADYLLLPPPTRCLGARPHSVSARTTTVINTFIFQQIENLLCAKKNRSPIILLHR